jgi:hypothetical protein
MGGMVGIPVREGMVRIRADSRSAADRALCGSWRGGWPSSALRGSTFGWVATDDGAARTAARATESPAPVDSAMPTTVRASSPDVITPIKRPRFTKMDFPMVFLQ